MTRWPAEDKARSAASRPRVKAAEYSCVQATAFDATMIVVGASWGANLPVTLYSDYNLQRIIYNNATSLYAEDGNFALHLPPAACSWATRGAPATLPLL